MSVQTVLVVDDSRTSRMLIRAIIGQRYPQAQILEAGDGEQALSMAKTLTTSLDLATVDLHMPGMDGLEVVMALRRRFPVAKLGLLTAEVNHRIQQGAAALGVSFIAKPITEESLLRFIEETGG